MCDCDPTTPSPDPVVVRLEAENAHLRGLLREAYDAIECTTYDLLLSGEWFEETKKAIGP